MKILKIVMVPLMVCISMPALHAQAKQRKVMLLQIAALQTYIGYAKKGYVVVKNGLNFIGDAKKGEINLHRNYFLSLSKVNSKVRNHIKVGEIIGLQLKIRKHYSKTMRLVDSGDLFHGDELEYILRGFEKVMESCYSILKDLMMIISDTTLEMKDDQRIERIEGLYKSMMEDFLFCEDFSEEIHLLYLSKTKEKNDSEQSQGLHGL